MNEIKLNTKLYPEEVIQRALEISGLKNSIGSIKIEGEYLYIKFSKDMNIKDVGGFLDLLIGLIKEG